MQPVKNDEGSHFKNKKFIQFGDSIEIVNKTNQDILLVVDYTLTSEPLFLRKKTLTKFKSLEKSVTLIQPSRCIYRLKSGNSYSVEKVVNGISRIRCTNPNKEEDKELNFFAACADSFDILPPVFFLNHNGKFVTLSLRDKKIENDFNNQINFLSRYVQKYNLSGEFYRECDYILKIAKYDRKTQILEKAKNIKELKDSIYRWRVETYQYYKDSLSSYLGFLRARDGNFNMLAKTLIRNIEILLLHDSFNEKFNSDNLEYFQIKQNNLSALLPHPVKDFVLTDNILDCINYGHIVSDSFWTEYKLLCENEMYKNYVEKILSQKKASSNYTQSPDFLLMNTNGNHFWWKKILESHKGRYIYLDFWASWCAPCRYELPFSKELASELSQKNIDFIYLSIDENKNYWGDAVKQENLLDSSKSFLIINPKGKYNYQNYKVNEIPRYMIFDKEGRLIDFDAPRPSEKKTKNKLLSLLNQ